MTTLLSRIKCSGGTVQMENVYFYIWDGRKVKVGISFPASRSSQFASSISYFRNFLGIIWFSCKVKSPTRPADLTIFPFISPKQHSKITNEWMRENERKTIGWKLSWERDMQSLHNQLLPLAKKIRTEFSFLQDCLCLCCPCESARITKYTLSSPSCLFHLFSFTFYQSSCESDYVRLIVSSVTF